MTPLEGRHLMNVLFNFVYLYTQGFFILMLWRRFYTLIYSNDDLLESLIESNVPCIALHSEQLVGWHFANICF